MAIRIALIDYGAGNLRSVARALADAGALPEVTAGPEPLQRADAIVVPGVGAFRPAMARLTAAGLVDPIRDAARRGTPVIGICLGMQLLFEESDEGVETSGFGLIAGAVRRLPNGVKVPHMGWNVLEGAGDGLFRGLPNRPYVYFVHSYVARPADSQVVIAEATHGVRFPAIVRQGTLWGLQFHPEKSSRVGARLLSNLMTALVEARVRA